MAASDLEYRSLNNRLQIASRSHSAKGGSFAAALRARRAGSNLESTETIVKAALIGAPFVGACAEGGHEPPLRPL